MPLLPARDSTDRENRYWCRDELEPYDLMLLENAWESGNDHRHLRFKQWWAGIPHPDTENPHMITTLCDCNVGDHTPLISELLAAVSMIKWHLRFGLWGGHHTKPVRTVMIGDLFLEANKGLGSHLYHAWHLQGSDHPSSYGSRIQQAYRSSISRPGFECSHTKR